jgi:hypothetical protein
VRALRRCTNCGAPYIHGCKGGICDQCHDFRERNGHLPADYEIHSRKALYPICTHCKSEYAARRGLCHACAIWESRHGTPRPAHHWQAFCKDCKEGKIFAKGLCVKCYQWRYRHNGKRLPRYKRATACTNCGKPSHNYAKGMCVACYKYKYETGKDRPAHLWQKWNPQVSDMQPHINRRCKVCGKPSVTQDGRDIARGRCYACYSYWRKHHQKQDRPAHLWQRWAPHGWCDCGKPAVTEVTLQVDHGATAYKLCQDCYRAEVGHD